MSGRFTITSLPNDCLSLLPQKEIILLFYIVFYVYKKLTNALDIPIYVCVMLISTQSHFTYSYV